MPRYYFDVRDGDGLHRDEIGLELESMDAALTEARRAIGDMARESLKSSSPALEIVIRDGDEGPVRLRVTLSSEDLHAQDPE